jgi:hypothetical protein
LPSKKRSQSSLVLADRRATRPLESIRQLMEIAGEGPKRPHRLVVPVAGHGDDMKRRTHMMPATGHWFLVGGRSCGGNRLPSGEQAQKRALPPTTVTACLRIMPETRYDNAGVGPSESKSSVSRGGHAAAGSRRRARLLTTRSHHDSRIAHASEILDEAHSREALRKVGATLALMDGCRTSEIRSEA